MKNSIMIYLLLLLCGCKDPNRRIESNLPQPQHTVADSVQQFVRKQFNIDEFEERLKKNPEYDGYIASGGTAITEFYRLSPEDPELDSFDRRKVLAYTRIEEQTDGYRIAYQFNNKGSLTNISHFYGPSLETGIWQQFDDNGKLIEEIDKDKGYAFTLKQVTEFGKQHGVDIVKVGHIEREYSQTFKANIWSLWWVVEEQVREPYQQNFILDGNTGKVLKEYKEKGLPQYFY